MNNPYHFALIREFIERIADHMDAGLDGVAAVIAAGEAMKREIRVDLVQCAMEIEAMTIETKAGEKMH